MNEVMNNLGNHHTHYRITNDVNSIDSNAAVFSSFQLHLMQTQDKLKLSMALTTILEVV